MIGNSRSDWLSSGKVVTSIKRTGRKKFEIHKNQHHFIITDNDNDSLSPVRRYSNAHFSLRTEETSVNKRLNSNLRLSPIEIEYYRKVLRDKDLEIGELKKKYKDTTERLVSFERSGRASFLEGYEKERGNALGTNRVYKETSEKLMNLQRTKVVSSLERDEKMKNGKERLEKFQWRLRNEQKFTKSRPKVVFTNPITGISPSYGLGK